MSFDVYVQRFECGDPSGWSVATIQAAFGEALFELEEDFWQVDYGDGQSSDLFPQPLSDNPGLIHTLTVHRPCDDLRLWHGIYALLEAPGALLYFPDCGSPLTLDERLDAAVPSALLESLGQPMLISEARDILLAVRSVVA